MHLKVEQLSAARGGRTVLENVSFLVTAGETLLLTGPNGAGKTTLLRTLAGYIRPLAGQITLAGGDPESSHAEQCHFVGHLNALKSNLTAAENLAFWQHYLGSPLAPRGSNRALRETRQPSARPQVSGLDVQTGRDPPEGAVAAVSVSPATALERLGLGGLGGIPAGFLSAGQRRRLALARLLVTSRPVWLLDEPTVSLDAASVATFAVLASEHVAAGGILVAATHVPLGLPFARTLQLGARAITA